MPEAAADSPGPSSSSAPSSSISDRLRRLAWLMLIPATGVSVTAGYAVYRTERDTLINAAMETARALSLVIDRELAVRAAVLRGLSVSPSLARGDYSAFRGEAERLASSSLMSSEDNTIVLADEAGQQLINTSVPAGQTLPRALDLQGKASAGAPDLFVSDMFKAPVSDAYTFAVRLPVRLAGEQRGQLSMGSAAKQMQKVFEQQPMPHGWLGVVLDGKGYVVARSLDPERRVGAQASELMLRSMGQSERGVVNAKTLDGVEVFTVFNRAPESGWAVLIGLHQQDLRSAALRAFAAAMAISGVFLVFTLWIARRAGRSIAEPLERLQGDAEQLGAGAVLRELPSGVTEIDVVQQSLARASLERARSELVLHEAVAQAVRNAEQASEAALRGQKLEALGQLTGGIAHDFNNILQTMTTGLQLARRLSEDPRAQRALDACQRASDKAAKLTQQLMTFGRQQMGREEVLDLERALAGFMELIRGALSEAVSARLQLQANIGAVRIDPVQFELAILNLALNARDAMNGRGELTLIAENAVVAEGGQPGGLAPGEYVTVTVRDNGPGMPAEIAARAFEPFFTTKPVGKGTGLGLAQVYAFARNAGGLAQISSAPGAGTAVTLWLPRSRLPVTPAVSELRPEAVGQFKGTVLLVEDEAAVLQLVGEALQRQGFTVLGASHADEALTRIRERKDIDIVLSDIVMPGERSGLDLAKTLRVLRPGLPVLLASGYAEGLDASIGVDVVAKPYDVEAVGRRLGQMLGQAGA